MSDVLYALVADGEVVEFRHYEPLTDQSELAPHKPRMLPVITEGEDYDPVREVREGPELIVEADRVRRVYTVRAKTEGEVEAMKLGKIFAIKTEAGARITGMMPTHRQMNALALAMQMVLLHGQDWQAWPQEAKDAVQPTLQAWEAIKAVRDASDDAELAVKVMSDPADVEAFDATGW